MISAAGFPDIAHGGPGWVERAHTTMEELGRLWGSCGVSSECGKLRRVAMYRPGSELLPVKEPATVHWNQSLDLSVARQEFDALIEVYRKHDVDVLEVAPIVAATPNLMFMRDLFVMTPCGAILARPASNVRAGEEVIVAEFLARNRIPILLSVFGSGVFEGPDLVFFDEGSAFVASGIRTNAEGARQVRCILEMQGIEVVDVETTYGCGHLDGVLSIVDRRKAVLYPTRVSYKVYETLRHRGYEIIPLPNMEEAEVHMAINMVALEPGVVIMPTNCPETTRVLRAHGLTTIDVDVSEIMKGGGAVHCITGIIERQSL